VPLALTALAAFFVLAFHYEWVHYFVHTRYKPRSRYYQRLWKNHRLHHFMNENYWYGVSMLSGDRLLGTQPQQHEVQPSPTCRTLGQMEDLGAR
jgi:sterol desaturase/sphingolipid hydroxylase (fatty acid hydroxylase superfamily)